MISSHLPSSVPFLQNVSSMHLCFGGYLSTEENPRTYRSTGFSKTTTFYTLFRSPKDGSPDFLSNQAGNRDTGR